MRRAASRTGAILALLVVAAGGVLVGFAIAFATSGSDATSSGPAATLSPVVTIPPLESTVPAVADSPTTAIPPLVMAWTSGGLPVGYGTAVAGLPGVDGSTVVRGDELGLVGTYGQEGSIVQDWTDGWRVPLDVLAVEPGAYADLVGLGPEFAHALGADGAAALTETSARLRGLGAGGSVELLDGTRLRVVATISDVHGSGAEVLVGASTGAAIGVTTERFVLARSSLARDELERALTDALPNPVPLRVRVEGESPYLRNGDAVLPLAQVKSQFGEFAFRPLAGREVEVDATWVAENIVTIELPIVGVTQCHVAAVAPLQSVLADLEARSLAHLVDPNGYAGCFVPRRIGPGLPLSRHSWGIAVDVNAIDNPSGSVQTKDFRLVEVFAEQGFGWGGEWLLPDPMHFEITSQP